MLHSVESPHTSAPALRRPLNASAAPPARQGRGCCVSWSLLERVLGLTIKAALLTAQRALDVLTLWRCGVGLESTDWWLLAAGTLASTALSAVTLSRHRCALRQNRPYGCCLATFVAVLQLAAVVEMVDKLGDGLCWGVMSSVGSSLVTGSSSSVRALPDMKGSRYGENLMRGLRKLCIASLPMVLLSTSVHLTRICKVLVHLPPCSAGCDVEITALGFGLLCLAMACADVVLYIWVDDIFVKRHKKLVQFHYLVELLARQPIMLLFFVVQGARQGAQALVLLWACDMFADMLLLLLPTLRTWARGRLSCRHGLSQVSTALIVSQLLFGVNITFFDPRDAFTVLNTGFYLLKNAEVVVMVKVVESSMHSHDDFKTIFQMQLAVTLLNAALVWVVVPWRQRAMDEHMLRSTEALPRLTQLLPGVAAAQAEPGTGGGLRRLRTSSMFSHLGVDLPVRDRALSLELGTVGGPQALGIKINASLIGEDSAMRLELLGDILEGLCLLSQTQSVRNRPVLSRTMVVNILWSLVLPCHGEYDDGSGGVVTLTTLDPEHGALLLRHTPAARPPAGDAEGLEEPRATESIALIFQGTAIEAIWPGEGRVVGSFDGRQICWRDSRRTVWVRREELGAAAASSEREAGSSLRAPAAAQEVLRLVLTQLLLALRWEPTFLGLGPRAAAVADGSLAAIDASQRPLICFLVRYALAAQDLVLVSEVYWSLWCLSQDPQDHERGAYEKARWVLVTALQGGLEFWDGDRGVRLDDARGTVPAAASAQGQAFRRDALQLLVRHGALWRQTVLLARLGADVQGDAGERTRVVRQRLLQWRAERRGLEPQAPPEGFVNVELLLDSEDPYLMDVGDGMPDCAPVNLANPSTCAFVSMPVDPGVRFLGVDVSGCEILASNAAPLLLSCWKEPEAPWPCARASGSAESSSAATAAEEPIEVQRYMVKVGDDLRQDQLVLQLLALMERVWRERLPAPENETLRLAPYRVLAMTPDAGYVKFVPGAVSLSKALCTAHGDLTAWLDASRPESMPLEEALNNLCGSVAAYCVATYCLGIGDRHLDNLQITPQGHFFHIDFGFIFGDDPKPFAPRLRLPQPVASALLGAPAPEGESAGQTLLDRCFLLAGRAYIALRRSMPLWVSLLRVTGEAGGAGCQRLRAHADAAVVMVRDRLRSDLGMHEEEAAVADFLLVLYESTEALYPLLTDKVHQLGLFWK